MNFNAIRVKLFIPPTNLYTLITGYKRFDHGIILNDDDELIIKDGFVEDEDDKLVYAFTQLPKSNSS